MTGELPLPQTATDVELARLVEWAQRGSCSSADVARLAEHLSASGERLSWSTDWTTADVASTGGPASLSTLLAPLVLVSRGYKVVKLAVPGRPAGAIDVLATVPGYRVTLTSDDVRLVIEKCDFAHFLSDNRFAPLDAALYAYRRRVGAVAVPVLTAASLLAKKLAVGVRAVGLDIRVGPHGNFGVTRNEARANAKLFCSAARALGIEATAFISASVGPAQPWIGRGEALLALALTVRAVQVEDRASWLRRHVADCYHMAALLAGDDADDAGSEIPSEALADRVRRALEKHLVAQGTTMDAFRARATETAGAPRTTLHSAAAGVLSVDLRIIRDVLVELQADGATHFRDPVGIELLVPPGRTVGAGEPLARIRCDMGVTDDMLARVGSAFRAEPEYEATTEHRMTEHVKDGSARDCREITEVIRA